ncbi:uncharacterized protein LOC133200077 [Saccostrea echinata]|uniref:uncharacterized protein LOC133200077 n=1 Tax=Saccostrea echinata TaxID=191078 RepID=UPI002A83779D|nr:uncharacterized protein LOC133200077 [Saccostrea echinata]
MDPKLSIQDVLRCDLCETEVGQLYCDFCLVNLCKGCVGDHILDDPFKHKVVQIDKRRSTPIFPKCNIHEKKLCEFQCGECNVHVCSLCISSEKHKRHVFSNLFEMFSAQKQKIQSDVDEIENIISPAYETDISNLETQINSLDGEYMKLTTQILKHGEDWHREVDILIKKFLLEAHKLKEKHFETLKKHLAEIKHAHSIVQHIKLESSDILGSNDVLVTLDYKSKNQLLRKFPPKIHVPMPIFHQVQIDSTQLSKLFGSLFPFSVTIEEDIKTGTASSLEDGQHYKPRIITSVDTGISELYSVTCSSDGEIWASGQDSEIKCFDEQGSLVNTITTLSEEFPNDIALTSRGDLVYSDGDTQTIYIVKNGKEKRVITLVEWNPVNIYVTSRNELLVAMFNADQTQSKVVRYSGSKENQTIMFDNEGRLLYSGNDKIKYITENRNLDICVADNEVSAIVVVNQTGEFRFRYTGYQSTTMKNSSDFWGIATDTQSQILTTDCSNHCVHILDQDGQFLRYIDGCGLDRPCGLFVDKNDNLLVAEMYGKVKKIKYKH